MISKKTMLTAAIAGLTIASVGMTMDAQANKHEKAEKGECHGVNSCKGKGECGGAGHSCAGENTCKGKGWVKMTKAECMKKKGKWQK